MHARFQCFEYPAQGPGENMSPFMVGFLFLFPCEPQVEAGERQRELGLPVVHSSRDYGNTPGQL